MKKTKQTNCEECMYYEYDEEYDDYGCVLDIDQDDTERFMKYSSCPFFKFGDEYTVVRKQN